MFDFDFSKLLLIGVIALIFIPPKDLPAAMRTVGQLIGKARRMAAEFQGQFNEAIREAELDNLKDEYGKLKQAASLEASMAHVRDVASAVAATAPIASAQAGASLENQPAQAGASLENQPAQAGASLENPLAQSAGSLETLAAPADGPLEPLPAAISVRTPVVAEAAPDVIMGPLAPAELETPSAHPVAAPLPPSA